MSYTELSAYTVLAACDKYLTKRNKRIHDEREYLIQETMKGIGPFFKKTREQAIASLEKYSTSWENIEVRGWSDACDVEELKTLAEIALKNDSRVRLDAESAYLLKNFF